MSDLISRKALNDALIDLFQEIDDMYIAGRVIGVLHLQPTVYDPVKIVQRLKAEYKPIDTIQRSGKTLRMGFNGGIARAIEIVKGGAE